MLSSVIGSPVSLYSFASSATDSEIDTKIIPNRSPAKQVDYVGKLGTVHTFYIK